VALFVLILINALANGSAIALAREATCKRRDAAARASATRRGRSIAAVPATPAARASTAPAKRSKPSSQALTTSQIQWTPAVADDVIDAEIVAEYRT
jgi:hypothetical protein